MKKSRQPLMQSFVSAIFAGIMIGIGGTVYLSCESRVVGALLFTVGLITICAFALCLYTGKVGYLPTTKNGATIAMIWLGNLVGTLALGLLLRVAKPELLTKASALCTAKLQQTTLQALILSIMCGVLMYVAVDAYKRLKDKGTAAFIGILVCIPTFILCGFEHSVADMFYFSLGCESLALVPAVLFYLIKVSVGNAVGGVLCHLCLRYLEAHQASAPAQNACAQKEASWQQTNRTIER